MRRPRISSLALPAFAAWLPLSDRLGRALAGTALAVGLLGWLPHPVCGAAIGLAAWIGAAAAFRRWPLPAVKAWAAVPVALALGYVLLWSLLLLSLVRTPQGAAEDWPSAGVVHVCAGWPQALRIAALGGGAAMSWGEQLAAAAVDFACCLGTAAVAVLLTPPAKLPRLLPPLCAAAALLQAFGCLVLRLAAGS